MDIGQVLACRFDFSAGLDRSIHFELTLLLVNTERNAALHRSELQHLMLNDKGHGSAVDEEWECLQWSLPTYGNPGTGSGKLSPIRPLRSRLPWASSNTIPDHEALDQVPPSGPNKPYKKPGLCGAA
jgi:hypothetical protein